MVEKTDNEAIVVCGPELNYTGGWTHIIVCSNCLEILLMPIKMYSRLNEVTLTFPHLDTTTVDW